ncbi:small-conductance mechanosensitive channel [Pararhizobium capsulatum DSM 1112]|uniref:Small-conductance mechanosensitive channel n=1 Tax=Pararhizobium capsulatum DSM 1112 TaxID=1121113 RepID=A0ABU0BTA8_9HYPH|nr:mechanosensitive ion channel family protein [Pararhizobium capsulatum]MDQ0321498.1 small-conductance mechanosensitive channel [Pararhizobium capsulatum DSM 1112]
MRYVFSTLLLVLLMLGTEGSSAYAQAAAAPPPEKLSELIKLLDDPAIRSWIANQQKAEVQSPTVETQDVEAWEARARSRFAALVAAVPAVPSEIAAASARVRAEASGSGFAPTFILLAAILAAGLAIEWIFKRFSGHARFGSEILNKLLLEAGPTLVFILTASIIFLAVPWPPLVRPVVLFSLLAVFAFRIILGVARLALAAGAASQIIYRRLMLFTGVLLFGMVLAALGMKLGVNPDARIVISLVISVVLLAIAVATVWRVRGFEGDEQPKLLTRVFRTLALVALWLLWVFNFEGLFWLGIFAAILPRILPAVDSMTRAFVETRWQDEKVNSPRVVLISRGARAIVIGAAVAWLAFIWHYDPNNLVQRNPMVDTIVGGLFKSVVILLLADLCWELAKSFIDRKLNSVANQESLTAVEIARGSRLRTLLPIFRNALAALVLVTAALMVLSEMGVAIGPLIAGAGVFGVAIGFGSQTLVKDIVSGVFYLMDDAFRVGEYIQSGSYKGTVESFSLRSIRLRHHRGPVFTVPFGELGAVQNMSRDWVIDKFRLRVKFDTDIEKARKLTKKLGAELLQDPELGPMLIEPLKMKGVEQISDFGIEISFSFTAKPGTQTMVRRRAYAMIRRSFAENGLEFAQPTVQVGGDEKADSTAAAAALRNHQMATEAAQAAAAEGS